MRTRVQDIGVVVFLLAVLTVLVVLSLVLGQSVA